MTTLTVLFQMLSLLLMIGAGAAAARYQLLDEHTNRQISGMIVNIFNPLLVVSCTADMIGTVSLKTFGEISLLALAMFLVYILAGSLTAPLYEKDLMQQKIYRLMFTFSNLGFIGVPVVRMVLGSEYTGYVAVFMLVYTVVFYTYGFFVMEGKFSEDLLKSMINPGNICWLISMLIVIFQIRIPDFLKTTLSYLGDATTPLALMSVGYILTTMNKEEWREMVCSRWIYIYTTVKMVVLPLLMYAGLKLLSVDPVILPVCLIMFGMPNGNMPLMLGTKKGIDCRKCTAGIVMTTVLSVVTIPLILIFVR